MWGSHSRDEQKPYRLGYPNQKDDLHENDMLRFYRGEIPSKPQGDYIDKIHERWFGNYSHLEIHHGYIQWIFPIREEGVNFSAGRLQKHELKAFRADPVIRARVIRSYEMMLDFYGMVLKDRDTGEVARNPDTYQARYHHLNSSFHNYLRISRILKALGEFGFERFKIHWIELFIEEIFVNGLLRNTLSSLKGFWVPTLRHRDERVAAKNKIHAYLKQADTDDEGDDMGDNEDMKDLPSPAAQEGTHQHTHSSSNAGSADSSEQEDSDEEEPMARPSGSRMESRLYNLARDSDGDSDDSGERGVSVPLNDSEDDLTQSQSHDTPASAATSVTQAMSSVSSANAEANKTETAPVETSSAVAGSSATPSLSLNPPSSGTPSITSDITASESTSKPSIKIDPAAELAGSLAQVSLNVASMAGSSSDSDSHLSASEDLSDRGRASPASADAEVVEIAPKASK